MNIRDNTKVAIVYDRVNKWGGAERVLCILHQMYPRADLFTSVYNPKKAKWASEFPMVKTTFLQKIPFANTAHQMLGTFMPLAFESLDFNDYDLVISLTSEAAKGVITQPKTKHICYMLTPTRYLWSHYDEYFKNPLFKIISSPFVNYLKYWDKVAAQRPDKIIAISNEVRKRIVKYYKRNANIIYPPVEIPKEQKKVKKGNYYLVVSRLESYKRIDLVIDAFNRLGNPLVVVGTGTESLKLRLKAKKNIKFIGFVDNRKLFNYYQNAKALIMPQREDFGIVSVEAQSMGTPVIGYKESGASETIVNGITGILFDKQTPGCIVDAVKRFDRMSFKAHKIKNNANRFSKEVFIKKFDQLISKL